MIVMALLSTSTAYADFSDVSPSTTSYDDAIEWMEQNGVVEGYSDGTFGIDECVNRAEYLVMLYNMLEIDTSNGVVNFNDVSQNDWFYEYVATGVERGSIDGSKENFNPGNCVNRVEAIKIAVIEFNNGEIPDKPEAFFKTSYEDVGESEWYSETFDYAYAANALGDEHVVWNGSYNYDPSGSMSRAEVAEMLYRLKAIEDYGNDGRYGWNDRPEMFNEDAYFFRKCSVPYENSDLDPMHSLPSTINFSTTVGLSDQTRIDNLNDYIDGWENSDFFTYARENYDKSHPRSLEYEQSVAKFINNKWQSTFAMNLDISSIFYSDYDAYFVGKVEKAQEFEEFIGRTIYHSLGNDIACSNPSEFQDTVYWDVNDGGFYARHKDIFIVAPSSELRDQALEELFEGNDNFKINNDLQNSAIKEIFSVYLDFNDLFGEMIASSSDAYVTQLSGIQEVYFEMGLSAHEAKFASAMSFDSADDPFYSAYPDYELELVNHAPADGTIFYFERPNSGYTASLAEELYISIDNLELTEDEIAALLDTPFGIQINHNPEADEFLSGSLFLKVNSSNAEAIASVHELINAELADESDDIKSETIGDIKKISFDSYGTAVVAHYGYLADDVYVVNLMDDNFLANIETPLSANAKYKRAKEDLGNDYNASLCYTDFDALEDFYDDYLVENSYGSEEEAILKSILDSLDSYVAASKAINNVVKTTAILKSR